MSVKEILSTVTGECNCGKIHTSPECVIESGNGAINKLGYYIAEFNVKKPFVLSDRNTERVAGKNVKKIIKEAGRDYTSCFFDFERIVPDEKYVGFAAMNYTADCDMIISVGSGVLNDIGKIISNVTGKPYILIATAPSMDGFASATSSMELKNLKISLPSRCADVVIGDTDILKTAPDILLQAGLGDMLAKYISICEWRISHIVTGEYYCEKAAQLVRTALKACTDNAEGLLKRDDSAVKTVFEGLVISGMAMNIAGCSRPASGIEHYFSHIWDMRSLSMGTPTGYHGINCAIGTYEAYNLYEKFIKITPDKNKATQYAKNFDVDSWNKKLREFIGAGAEAMIEAEKKDGKYDPESHAKRLAKILDNWEEIVKAVKEELPQRANFEAIYKAAKIPVAVE